MTDFFDKSGFDRHFNYHAKIGNPNDTEILVSGIERVYTNSLYAKIDHMISGLNGIVISGVADLTLLSTQTSVDFMSGKLSTMQAMAGADTKTIVDKIDQVELGAVWEDGVEASGSLINLNLDVKLSLFSGQLGLLPTDNSSLLSQLNYISGQMGLHW